MAVPLDRIMVRAMEDHPDLAPVDRIMARDMDRPVRAARPRDPVQAMVRTTVLPKLELLALDQSTVRVMVQEVRDHPGQDHNHHRRISTFFNATIDRSAGRRLVRPGDRILFAEVSLSRSSP